MIETLKNINTYLADFDNIIGVIGVIVGIIGLFVGAIGIKQIVYANKIKISKSEVSNSQVANKIKNYGMGAKDTEYIANRIIEEKTKNVPNVHYSKEEPLYQKEGDIWCQTYDE